MKKILLSILIISGFVYSSYAQNDDNYIYHKVEAKETLYSLVKKYETDFNTVVLLNPSLAENKGDIKIGQILKFPKSKADNRKKTDAQKPVSPLFHEVQPKETVYSISKLYNLDIYDFVRLNNIIDNQIKIGQKLKVGQEEINKNAVEKEPQLIMDAPQSRKIVKETGIAEIIHSDNRSGKNVALHRSAPRGSTIRITNEATGYSVVAKVIGKLSEKGPDENVMIKLSPNAYYQLRPKDSRLRATVEYYAL